MKVPTSFELNQLSHGILDSVISQYDPVKAHEYYERHKKLKGRKRGQVVVPAGRRDPRIGNRMSRIHSEARVRQRKELSERIQSLSKKLNQLETKIREMEHKEASENRKGKAKKERAAKEKDKPKSAAEKAKDARENKKFREKHRQELKTEAKKDSGGSSSKSKKSDSKKSSLSDLRALATKVKGQIAVAKQKLAAL